MKPRPFCSTLVLGGGGARGLAHIGAIEVLAETGILPDRIVGTSIGAVLGAAFALQPDTGALGERIREGLQRESLQQIERRFEKAFGANHANGWRGRLQQIVGSVRRLVLWNRQALRESLVERTLINDLIDWLVGRHTFEDLRIPFVAVAFDLIRNTDVVLGSGDLTAALLASSAIPGVFEPIDTGDRLLVDGCVREELPTRTARALGADFVIAVDVGPELGTARPRSAAEVMRRVLAVRGEHVRNQSHSQADVIIRPAVADLHWSEFSRAEECFRAGREAARATMESIRSARRAARWRSLPRRLLTSPPAPGLEHIAPLRPAEQPQETG